MILDFATNAWSLKDIATACNVSGEETSGKLTYIPIIGILIFKLRACDACGVKNESTEDIIKYGFRTTFVRLPDGPANLADYDIEVVEVLLDDFDEKSHFPYITVEILGSVKNLDVIKVHLRGVDKLFVNSGSYFNDEWTEGQMAKLFKIFHTYVIGRPNGYSEGVYWQ
ncbi:hypothetical protein A6J77_006885 [Aerococcus viridans]|uniref:Uncharacterized protein n=2 Tax=Aerococcus viridans TaxID=1377 RepID=A0A2J9PNV2_9LACT|nr:hypothetical protein A6J77_006885 [Aerococcus viridans]